VAETLPTVTINKINGNDIIVRSDNANDKSHEEHGVSAVTLSGTVSGIAANSTFKVSVRDDVFSKSYTATVNAAGSGWTATIPAADVRKLPNGTATVTAQADDRYGNSSLPAVQLVAVEGAALTQISGFGGQDRLDFADIAHTTLGYSSDQNNYAIGDTASTAKLALLGQYAAASFVTAGNGHGGTLITDPPPDQQSWLAHPHT